MNYKINIFTIFAIVFLNAIIFTRCSTENESDKQVSVTQYQQMLDSLQKEIQKYEQTRNYLNDSIAILYSQMSGDNAIKANLLKNTNETGNLSNENIVVNKNNTLNTKEQIIRNQLEKIEILRKTLVQMEEELRKKDILIANLQQNNM